MWKDDKRWPDAVIPFYERDPDLVDYRSREEQTNVHHDCVPGGRIGSPRTSIVLR